jgi:hypothetical protein
MAGELVTCTACGTKNASHRAVCISCGGDLQTSKDGKQLATQSFVRWVGSLAKSLNTPWRWSVAALCVVAVYFGLTWFFFGSSHPCGILEARQKPYVVSRYTEDAGTLLSMQTENYMRSPGLLYSKEIQKQYNMAVQNLANAPKTAARDLHERIWNHFTPAKCVRESLAWNPDPYKDSLPLKEILRTAK